MTTDAPRADEKRSVAPSQLQMSARYVLIPGAGGAGRWYWQRVEALLEDAIAVDLPGPDPTAGLAEYTELVAAAADGRDDVVLVAQSMGAFTALAAFDHVRPRRLVFLNAMIPAPGETASEWWRNTGWDGPEPIDLQEHFLHDVPAEFLAMDTDIDHNEADIAFEQPCPFERWPDVPTTVLSGRDDRFFGLDFQRRVSGERLGLDVVELPGGHLNALSRPEAVASAVTSPSAARRR
jgi:pimeloyl-ACP methyl ester carboxylesterase